MIERWDYISPSGKIGTIQKSGEYFIWEYCAGSGEVLKSGRELLKRIAFRCCRDCFFGGNPVRRDGKVKFKKFNTGYTD